MRIKKLQRSKAPDYKNQKKLSYIEPQWFQSRNGTTIAFFPIHDQEVVKIDFIFDAGDYASPNSALLPLSTLAMLQEGSLTHTSEEIAESLDFLGSYITCGTTKDKATISVFCLEKHVTETLQIVADFILNPTFPEEKLAVHLQKRQERYKIDIERVEVLAQKKLAQVLFGQDHPYGRSYDIDDFSQVTTHDIRAFHKKVYCADTCTILMCGNPKSGDVQTVLKYFLNTPLGKGNPDNLSYEIISDNVKRHYIEKENALQSSLNIGKVLVNRNHHDYIPLQILNTVLGGYFGSRLMSNVREEKGFTYSIGSGIISMNHAGYFIITSQVRKDVRQEALDAIYTEIRKLREELIPDEELNMVRTYMQSTLIRNFDGAFATSEMLHNILGYSVVFDTYYKRFWKTLRKISSKDLIELANKYFQEDSLYEVVVG